MVIQIFQVDLGNGQPQCPEMPAERDKGFILLPVQVDSPDGTGGGTGYAVILPRRSGCRKFIDGLDIFTAPPAKQVVQQL